VPQQARSAPHGAVTNACGSTVPMHVKYVKRCACRAKPSIRAVRSYARVVLFMVYGVYNAFFSFVTLSRRDAASIIMPIPPETMLIK